MERVGNVNFSVRCNICNEIFDVTFTNEKWEQKFYVNDAENYFSSVGALVFVTCPNCGHGEEVRMD